MMMMMMIIIIIVVIYHRDNGCDDVDVNHRDKVRMVIITINSYYSFHPLTSIISSSPSLSIGYSADGESEESQAEQWYHRVRPGPWQAPWPHLQHPEEPC